MEHLILHPATKQHIAQFLQRPSHAVLLLGSTGMGKTALATALAAGVLDLDWRALANYPYYSLVKPDGDSISIVQIRELQRFMQLKTLGDRPLRRAAIIEHAEQLTSEAQNAYLKLLEEPPADTVMILTADNLHALLPTIRSRLHAITVYAPSEAELKAHFGKTHNDTQTLNQAYFLSGGLPGLMHALLQNETHPLAAAVAAAKLLLSAPTFERLIQIDALAKQKDGVRYVVEALQHIAQTGLDQAARGGDASKVKQWHRILRLATDAGDALHQNANPKLALSDLALKL